MNKLVESHGLSVYPILSVLHRRSLLGFQRLNFGGHR